IAIDGHSSCGKSTVAKAVAMALNFVCVDSGVMYRAVTLYFLLHGIDFNDQSVGVGALVKIQIDFVPQLDSKADILLNGENVSEEIRAMAVSDKVSEVAAIKAVRTAMVAQQQALGSRRNIVMDGRDIGTTVFPDADLKIFMTADPEVRAARRYVELKAKGQSVSLDEIRENLAHRDHIDSTREESPLRQADDAVVLDNSAMNHDTQLQFVLDLVAKIEKKNA